MIPEGMKVLNAPSNKGASTSVEGGRQSRSLHIGLKMAKALQFSLQGFHKKAATYSPANAVPSALMSLTSLFGMVRGGTSSL